MKKYTKLICWYCNQEIKGRLTYHHLFNHQDIRNKICRTFKEPTNDKEHKRLHQLVNGVKKNIPQYPVHKGCHEEIERKFA